VICFQYLLRLSVFDCPFSETGPIRTMPEICTELPYRLMLGRRIMLKASAEYQPDCRTDRCRAIAYAKAHTAVYAKGITKLMV
jgi:hypothetical protein